MKTPFASIATPSNTATARQSDFDMVDPLLEAMADGTE
jgi:hypothetical protein